jgi:hypothetical protein
MDNDAQREFERLAAGERVGLARELIAFLGENKKWWLTPIVIAVLLLGVLVLVGGSGALPFVYTLF